VRVENDIILGIRTKEYVAGNIAQEDERIVGMRRKEYFAGI
jgi:hypothetical protein